MFGKGIMADNRVLNKPIELVHKEDNCEGVLSPGAFSTNSNGSLVVHGLCTKCKRPVNWEKSLSELLAECPRSVSLAVIPKTIATQADKEFERFMEEDLHYSDECSDKRK